MTDPITTLKQTPPNPQYRPPYDVSQGRTAWRFSDLVRRLGYKDAAWWAEFIRDRVPGISPECTLIKTYAAFCEADKN